MAAIRVKLSPNGQTDEQTNGRTTKRRVSLSVVSFRGVHPMVERTAMLHINLRGGIKNPRSSNKYTKFGQLTIRKIIKIIATRCHILKHQILFTASVRPSIRSFVRS